MYPIENRQAIGLHFLLSTPQQSHHQLFFLFLAPEFPGMATGIGQSRSNNDSRYIQTDRIDSCDLNAVLQFFSVLSVSSFLNPEREIKNSNF